MGKPSLIIVDRDFPDGGGFIAMRQLSERFSDKKMLIIMMARAATQEDHVESLAAGARGVIPKPFTAEALQAKLEEIHIRELRREIGDMLFDINYD